MVVEGAENTNESYKYGKKDAGHLERERRSEKQNFELLRGVGALDDCKRLLVIGCPNMFFIENCTAAGMDAKGVDIDPSVVDGKAVLRCDMESGRLPFKDGEFDVVYSKGLIQHLGKPPANFMKEARRVLKAGGRLVLLVRNEKSLLNILSVWDNYKHRSTWTPMSVRGMLETFGFEVEHLNPRFKAGVLRPLLCVLPFKWSVGGTIVAVARKK
jgi:SAM-dependent methyltransferase